MQSPKQFSKKRAGAKASVVSRYKRSRSFPNAIVPRLAVREKDQASCVCTLAYSAGGTTNLPTNVPLEKQNTQLIDFPRAASIAKNFQFYRITRITLRFKPQYDTFAVGASKLRLYYLIDKGLASPILASAGQFRDMGCVPIDLDERSIDVTFKPGVLRNVMYTPVGAGAASSSEYTISPWLSTNSAPQGSPWVASGTDHCGIQWIVDQSTNNATYEVEVQAEFEFKKPLTQYPLT